MCIRDRSKLRTGVNNYKRFDLVERIVDFTNGIISSFLDIEMDSEATPCEMRVKYDPNSKMIQMYQPSAEYHERIKLRPLRFDQYGFPFRSNHLNEFTPTYSCLLYTSPSPRDQA
eukprot:TRINITY_DN31343_c0_g1_i1.p1 TRINITY_DN31343_c0_g1~~TRINITY_DN31343_c0_g1_i1.p1  ORF type:complete len:115 (+),score=26.30 TRINITY_DN31343_c0_g1_i1:64-408(+)